MKVIFLIPFFLKLSVLGVRAESSEKTSASLRPSTTRLVDDVRLTVKSGRNPGGGVLLILFLRKTLFGRTSLWMLVPFPASQQAEGPTKTILGGPLRQPIDFGLFFVCILSMRHLTPFPCTILQIRKGVLEAGAPAGARG